MASDRARVFCPPFACHTDEMRFEEERPSLAELLSLYDGVGWTAYTREPKRLAEAIAKSTWVLAARDDAGALVGLVRVVGDDTTIAYVQDLLVAPRAQRAGIGRALLLRMFERFAHVRQVVLLTDAEDAQRRFYESCGFVEAYDVEPDALRSFVRLAS